MLYGLIVFLGVLVDQLTKLWVSRALVGKVIEVIPGVINFRYVENTGAAFGMFGSGTIVLAVFSALLSVAIAVFMIMRRRKNPRMLQIALAIILAGALGNLIDRAIAGYVVDFIEFAFVNFAVFNMADVCITVGTALLVIYILFFSDRKGKTVKGDVTHGREQHGPGDEGAVGSRQGDSCEERAQGETGEAPPREGGGEAGEGEVVAAGEAEQTDRRA